MNKRTALGYKIHKAYNTILQKENSILHYNFYAYSLLQLETFLHKNGMIDEVLENSGINKTDLNFTKEKLISYNRTFSDVNNELTFKAYFQMFEAFIFQVFTCLYSTYPIFLKKDNLKFDLAYENIFSTSNINEIQNLIIENRVKRTIQSNNISNTLQKFKKVFGFDVNIDDKDFRNIILASLHRNILTHNNGIVNRIYLQEITFHNLSKKYNLGDCIFPQLNDHIETLQNTVNNISTSIFDSISDNLTQIDKYASNLEKN